MIKIQGVLLLKMDLWRIEEASISHLVCILCIPEVFWRTFVKQTSIYHFNLLVKILLLLKMDLWRIEEAFISSWCHIKYEGPILWYLMRFSGEKIPQKSSYKAKHWKSSSHEHTPPTKIQGENFDFDSRYPISGYGWNTCVYTWNIHIIWNTCATHLKMV